MRKHIFLTFVVPILALIALLWVPGQSLAQRYRVGMPVAYSNVRLPPGYYGYHAYYPRPAYNPYLAAYRYPVYSYPAYRYPAYRYPAYHSPWYYSRLYVRPVYTYPTYSYYNYYVTPPVYAPSYSSGYIAPVPQPTGEAILEVRLPAADAELWIEGVRTTDVGTMRTFISPALTTGVDFTYNLWARWVEGGRTVERTREARVRAGERTTVDFGVSVLQTAPRPGGP
jgi:uncharacterized protein (TIGR03000 family)